MDLDRSVPLWPQATADLRRRLRAREWRPGERFPSTITLAAEYRITQSTAQKAIVQLRKEGRVHTILGAGSYVTD